MKGKKVEVPIDIKCDIEKFIERLRFRKFSDSAYLAKTTLDLLKNIISNTKWTNASDLMDVIKKEGSCMIEANPIETAVGNVIKRVLKIIRDEYSISRGKHVEGDLQESLQNMLLAEGQTDDYGYILPNLREQIIEGIDELFREIDSSADNIVAQALEHIHSDEVIMTAGKSRSVECFLKTAAKKRKFQVIVAESAPFYNGQEMAKNLALNGIETIVISDSAIFSIMSRVNKVIIGTHSVMANGGLKAFSGSHALALAAKHYSVPLIVCVPVFKLTPQYLCSHDQDAFNCFASPQDVMTFGEGRILSDVQIINPVFDYVPPELVTLFVLNIGGNSPTYIYRLLSELYHPNDYVL